MLSNTMEWKRLIEHMTREQVQVERIAAITEATKFLFESGPDDKAAARRVHAAAEKLIAEGKFGLPAPQVLIEDPIHGGAGRQFYLCTQRADHIEVWGATKLYGRFVCYRTPKSISLSIGTSWMDDVNSPTIAVKEFILAMNNPMAAKIENEGAYTHVGWIKGPTPPTRRGDFEDFINALCRGEVTLLDPVARAETPFIEHDPDRWSVPVYDFGPLLYGAGAGGLDSDLLDRLLEEAPEVALPAGSCVFLFRGSVDSIRGDFTKLVRVDGLLNGRPNVTFVCAHVQRHLRYADMTLHPGYWSVVAGCGEVPEGEALSEIACRLLAAWRDNFEIREARNYRTAKINKKRLAANHTPIQQTQTIHITEQRVVYLREQLAARTLGTTGRVMPRHKRTITDRWIYPKSPGARQFRPYQRQPKSIVVNQDRAPVPAHFRVVE